MDFASVGRTKETGLWRLSEKPIGETLSSEVCSVQGIMANKVDHVKEALDRNSKAKLWEKLELGLVPDEEIKHTSNVSFFENSVEWDAFGEVINPDDYVIKEEYMDQSSMLGGADLDNKLDEGSANLILDSKPSKVISNELTVQVKCSLVYMDFEGRSDGRSIKSILAHVAPLKLVLVHGSAEATEHLKQHCLKLVCSQVYAPQIGETIDVTSDLCAYKVQLSEGLMSNVLFKKLGDYEIAWVNALREHNLANLETILADITTYEMNKEFDRVMVISVFEHLKNYDELFLRKTSKWMKADGFLFIEHWCHRSLAYEFKASSN
ncbi:hypothetical protein Scep_018943 [Stephania cephalantha]|uniref:Cleavage and polyadenylation specificity factor subunit 2 n=1 Tax=Stephania cephalantha TaxID=152367 RepID=A0AAP0I9S9_9MAGN